MQDPYYRRGLPPWVWVLIVLGAILLVFVVWWTVAAGSRQQIVVVPAGGETTVQPSTQPAQPAPAQPAQPTQPTMPTTSVSPSRPTAQSQKPIVIVREHPVNVYVQPKSPTPSVIVVPKNEQPPAGVASARPSSLPGAFSYQNKTWQPSNEAVTDKTTLRNTGAVVNGDAIYVKVDAQPPYDELYVETSPGSGILVRYDPS